MVSRSTLKDMASLALAVTLFTQAALVFAACDSARRAPALVLSELQTDGEGCHEQAINVNLCLAHCLGEDQSLDKPSVTVPALGDAAMLLVVLPVSQRALSMFAAAAPARASAPPPRILFSKLLI